MINGITTGRLGQYDLVGYGTEIIPITAGDKLTYSGNTNNIIGTNFTLDFYPVKSVSQEVHTECLGSGGVIDGTILVPKQTFNTGTISNWSYTVKNDCMIYIYTQHFIQSFKINGSPLTYNETGENGWLLAPVKANSIITATGSFSLASEPLYVTEYELIDTNPQVAFPDWDGSKVDIISNGDGSSIFSDYTITKNGYINISPGGSNSSYLYINGILSYDFQIITGVSNNYLASSILVSKGDIISLKNNKNDSVNGNNYLKIDFYPAKAVAQPQCVS
jgi:hypothetical protein